MMPHTKVAKDTIQTSVRRSSGVQNASCTDNLQFFTKSTDQIIYMHQSQNLWKSRGSLWWGSAVWDSTLNQQTGGLTTCCVPCACSPRTSHVIRLVVLEGSFWHSLCRPQNWLKEKFFPRVTGMLQKCFLIFFSFLMYIWGRLICFVSNLFNSWWQLVENYFLEVLQGQTESS